MENHPKPQDKEYPSLHPSSLSSTSSSCSNHSATNGAPAPPPPSSSPPPLTPKSIPKPPEASNPYPTTFVQADTSSFKQVVQMLTGTAETAAAAAAAAAPNPAAPKNPASPPGKATGPKKQAFKLYERRNSLKNLRIISPLMPAFYNPNPPIGGAASFSPRKQVEVLSPSTLDFPSLLLSPVTPLIPDPFNRPPHPSSEAAMWAEDRAIAEKGFYLHPSPRTTPRDAEPPRLLPLFPVTSPRASSASSSP